MIVTGSVVTSGGLQLQLAEQGRASLIGKIAVEWIGEGIPMPRENRSNLDLIGLGAPTHNFFGNP